MTDGLERLRTGLADRYAIERELGSGGMAMVYLARDIKHDRDVALKVLRPELAVELGGERFLREIKLAAKLSHPHVLPLYDSGEAESFLFYVMPAMEGESLRDRLRTAHQLPVDEACQITREVADALDYAHRHDVVHRDIKPENILLHEGHALVADFGIGKAVSGAVDTETLTQTGVTIGTPAYMSPEQASGQDAIDGRSDLYSLGCVLYEMLTGEQPFTGQTAQAVIAKRFAHTPRPVTESRKEVPTGVSRAVAKLLEREPPARYGTGREVVAALSGQFVAAAPSEPAEKSIAVLPFANLSADPENEYFSDGITEEIINALSGVPDLHVASRTSCFFFKDKSPEMAEVGAKLGVATVLEGSVRKAGNRVRITAQLVDVSQDEQLWSEKYDREMDDIFAVQDEIATAIVERLKATLVVGDKRALVEPPTANLDAYHLYLKGRHLWYQRGEAIKQAIEYFRRAVEADPDYALAQAGLADAYVTLAIWGYLPARVAHEVAKPAAERALARSPDLAEANFAAGYYECMLGWDLDRAERLLRNAMDLKPNNGLAPGHLAILCSLTGRFDEVISLGRIATAREPLSHYVRMLAGYAYVLSRRPVEALEASHGALAMADRYAVAHWVGGLAHHLQGRYEEAAVWLERAVEYSGRGLLFFPDLGAAYERAGRKDDARRVLREMRERPDTDEGWIGGLELALGETEAGFAHLEVAFREQHALSWTVGINPDLAWLNTDPRWIALMESVGLGWVPERLAGLEQTTAP